MQFFDEGHGYDLFGLTPGAVDRALRVAAPFHRHYFRVTTRGTEHLPSRGGAIFAPNHSGMLPIDAAMLWFDVTARTGRVLRTIADRFIPRLPFLSTWFARTGVVAGSHTNVAHLLERGELVAIFPEGVTGPAKPFFERYHLQQWRVGHAEHAIRHEVPIIPVAIIGAEEAWPVLARIPWRMFGAPYLPIPLTPLPLPVRIEIHYGRPIELAGDADDPHVIAAAALRVRRAVEELLPS
jgi:1-acyl-sn-glycerol-3-phosphate acyltransferase